MRSLEDARVSWESFVTIGTVEDLRRQFDGSLSTASDTIPRSACWKANLVFHSLNHTQWPSKLHDSRHTYTTLRSRFFSVLENPNETASSADSLSDSRNTSWDTLQNDEAARDEILLDVERCIPENQYFRQPETQTMLLDILFVWSKLNPDVGYRQGMHEILALIIWVVERDAIDTQEISSSSVGGHDEDIVRNIFDARYIAHDSFTLFLAVMQNLKSCYESSGQNASRTEEPAMITRSKRVIDHYLSSVDPQLASHMTSLDIAPQIFLMRWMRLLFSREFPFDDVLPLWDCIFLQDSSLEIIDLVCISMLLRIRWQLIDADFNASLGLLLHYPPLQHKHPPRTLVKDAMYLKDNLDSESGCRMITKYTGRSPPRGEALHAPEQRQDQQSRGRNLSRALFEDPSTRSVTPSSNIENLLQTAAKGVLSRGEKWGVNKAVREAVGEVRRNVPVLQNNMLANARAQSDLGSETTASRRRETSNNWLARIAALEERNKSLAKMLEGALADLWTHQNDAVANNSAEDESVRNLTMAIAKVQLTQVYLADASLPLPNDDDQASPGSQNVSINPSTNDGKDSENSIPGNLVAANDSDTASSKDGVDVITGNRTIKSPLEIQDRKLKPREIPSQDATPSRPTLEHSNFSWMLGQQYETHPISQTSTTRSSTVTHRRHESDNRKNAGFLFGDPE